MPKTAVNHFAGGTIDRAATRRADPDWLLAQVRSGSAVAVPVHGSDLWITGNPPRALRLPADVALVDETELARWIFLGILDGRATFAFDSSALASERFERQAELRGLREIAARVDRADGCLLAYANALVSWQRACRFCGGCGGANVPRSAGHVMYCPSCEREHYPRTSPAVIVLVHDGGDRCLLGRQRSWPAGVYSTLAGFVEPGESLEEAVRREVHEEVGVTIETLCYDSSQPWPFPDSLMVGFHALASSTAIQLAETELEDARWFDRSELLAPDVAPRRPPHFSIARRLIDTWAAG